MRRIITLSPMFSKKEVGMKKIAILVLLLMILAMAAPIAAEEVNKPAGSVQNSSGEMVMRKPVKAIVSPGAQSLSSAQVEPGTGPKVPTAPEKPVPTTMPK